jgi:cobalamin-dependent methionine synthase I
MFLNLKDGKLIILVPLFPTKEILKFVKQIDPEVIALSWSLYLNLGRFLEVVDHLTRFFPTKKILVGGQALAENSDKVLKNTKMSNILIHFIH